MSIFTNLNHDIEWQVIGFLDAPSLKDLSCINKASYYIVLTNDDFFKKLFKARHPTFTERETDFKFMCTTHPNNCWKVICCAFSMGVLRVNTPFIEGSIPFVVDHLKLVKIRAKTEFENRCGSYFADPLSPIDIAWKALKKGEQEVEMNRERFFILCDFIASVHLPEEVNHMMSIFDANKKELLNLNEDQLNNQLMFLSGNDFGFLNRKLIPNYLSIISLLLLSEKVEGLRKVYKKLEETKDYYSNVLNLVDEKLIFLNLCSTDPTALEMFSSACRTTLENEFKQAQKFEILFSFMSIYQECRSILPDLFDFSGTKKCSPDELNRIHLLINSIPHEIKQRIWRDLYKRCAKGVQEDQWSEKHFPEFLHDLHYVLFDFCHQNCSGVMDYSLYVIRKYCDMYFIQDLFKSEERG